MTSAEWLDRLTALLTFPPDPAPVGPPPDPAAALDCFEAKFGPVASGPNETLSAMLRQLQYQLNQHATRVYSAAEDAIRQVISTADGMARAGTLPGGCIWWDRTPGENRVAFTPPFRQVGAFGPPAYHAVLVTPLWSPPEAAVTAINGQRYVVFGRHIRPWVSSAFAAAQGEELRAIVAAGEERQREVNEQKERERELASAPRLSPAEIQLRRQAAEIETLKRQLQTN